MARPEADRSAIDAAREAARRHWLARRPDRAESLFRQVLDARPEDAVALEGMGLIVASRGDEAAARDYFERALAANPDQGGAAVNLASLLAQTGRFDEARRLAQDILVRSPDNALVMYILAEAQRGLGETDLAFATYDAVAALSGEIAGQVERVIQERLQQCDWRTYDHDAAFARKRMRSGTFSQTVLPSLISDSPVEIGQAVRSAVAWRYPPKQALAKHAYPRRERIRLGYLTSELCDHPVGNLMTGVLEHHDRTRFELYAFSHGAVAHDATHERLAACFDHLLEVGQLDDEAIARIVRDCEIDVLVTLSGLTRDARPGILSHRPAPVQVNYLGYPGTMGAPYIDYMIADQRVIPQADIAAYDEQIVWMPHAYQPTDDAAPISARLPSRAEEGLPEGAFVFMAYNAANKITPGLFDSWMRILTAVKDSVLWLSVGAENTAANLRREAQARGVDPGRLVFARRRDERAEHIARHRLADLFLDTFRYNAHSTASDALWAGLPVITCRGTTLPGRVCADLLEIAGLADMITDTVADYEALAIALANDPRRLAALRARVASDTRASPLFDTARYVAHLEAAFTTIYETSQRGAAPQSFAVETLPPTERAAAAEAPAAPPQIDVLIELGRRHWRERKIDLAEAAFNEARAIEPDSPPALEGLAFIARHRGNDTLARALLSQAVEKDPTLPGAALNLAAYLESAGRAPAAQAMVERVIEAYPGHAVARSTLAQILWRRGLFHEAYEAFEKAAELDSEHGRFIDTWSYERLGECDWSGYEVQVEALTTLVRAGRDVSQPYAMMLMTDDPAVLQLSARAYAAKRFPPRPAIWTGRERAPGPIRVGYLTAEIYDHPVANLLASVWEGRDRAAFETTCFSYGPPSDHAVQDRYRAAFDSFFDVSHTNDEGLARLIHERGIDIAVTLNGYTYNARPGILSWRPARVQASLVGFPGTMGVPWVDYLIADRRVAPEADFAAFDEKVVWLPNAYLPGGDAETATGTAPTRADQGLPKNAFVFAAFNHSYKITPAMFGAWMRILTRVPQSVLWLADKDAVMRANLSREAAARGVNPARLIFAARTESHAAHLARHRLADLFLDTAPYSAHATAIDAIRAGLPIVTLRCGAFPGRVCADLLTVAGAPDLAVDTLEAYEALAVSLARTPGRLAMARTKLRREAPPSPLFDNPAYVRALEQAYRTMHETALGGLAPRAFAVD